MNYIAKWIVVILVMFLLGAGVMAAFAHDDENPALDPWYEKLRSDAGHPCCEGPHQRHEEGRGTEIKHLSDVEWKTKDRHYIVWICSYPDGSGTCKWMDVPDTAVITGPNLDGRATVWQTWGDDPKIRCFIPGVQI